MAKPLTAERLIASVKRRAQIPANQITFQPQDFLDFANEEMSIGLVPSILQVHEDYLLFEQVTPLEDNKNNYQIPYRAVGNKLRDIAFRDNNGNTFEMTRIPIEDISEYPINNSNTYYYTIKNNEVVLISSTSRVSNTGNLVFYYYIAPSDLVLESEISVIRSIDRNTGILQVDKVPSDWSTNDTLDFVQVQSPHRPLSIDKLSISLNPTLKTITFDPSIIPNNLAVGDHITLANESNIPQVPTDLHVVLAHRVATRCLEAIGDLQNLQAANAKLAEMEMKTNKLINNRVEGSPQKVKNKHGFLRQSSNRRQRNNW